MLQSLPTVPTHHLPALPRRLPVAARDRRRGRRARSPRISAAPATSPRSPPFPPARPRAPSWSRARPARSRACRWSRQRSAGSRPTSTSRPSARDGDSVAAKTELMTIAGDARAVLSAERAALNLLGHLSGIATATAEFVRADQGHADAHLLHAQDHARACARSKNTRCAAAAASTTASASTTRC